MYLYYVSQESELEKEDDSGSEISDDCPETLISENGTNYDESDNNDESISDVFGGSIQEAWQDERYQSNNKEEERNQGKQYDDIGPNKTPSPSHSTASSRTNSEELEAPENGKLLPRRRSQSETKLKLSSSKGFFLLTALFIYNPILE